MTNKTVVLFKPTKREKKLAAKQKKDGDPEEEAAEPLRSLDQVTVGMAMTYEGTRDRATGKILC